MAYVQTVRGAVAPETLGYTLPHEHLFIDVSHCRPDVAAEPTNPALWHEPISLRNYYYARRNIWDFEDSLRLASLNDATDAMRQFKAAGGTCIVEVTSGGIGRDPKSLRQVSETTGVHVVMGTGYYVNEYHPPHVASTTVEGIRNEILQDLVEGTGEDRIKAGIIGEIGLTWPVHPDEAKVLRAAVLAQVETGVALTIHTGRHPEAPLDSVHRVAVAGGDVGRTIIGHLDRTIFELDNYLEVAKTGCYLELDLFGLESSYYTMAPIDMPNDGRRLDLLGGLIEHGYADHVLISQDIDTKTRLHNYGGEGYEHLLTNVMPLMRRKGLDQSTIDLLMIANPARVLTQN